MTWSPDRAKQRSPQVTWSVEDVERDGQAPRRGEELGERSPQATWSIENLERDTERRFVLHKRSPPRARRELAHAFGGTDVYLEARNG